MRCWAHNQSASATQYRRDMFWTLVHLVTLILPTSRFRSWIETSENKVANISDVI